MPSCRDVSFTHCLMSCGFVFNIQQHSPSMIATYVLNKKSFSYFVLRSHNKIDQMINYSISHESNFDATNCSNRNGLQQLKQL